MLRGRVKGECLTSASSNQNKAKRGLIYLLRHGEIENPGGGRRYIGRQDLELNQQGREQARFWAEQFADVDLEAIYTSPLRRCLDTAGIIGRRCGQPSEPITALQEIDLGAWEGCRMETIRDRYPKDYARRGGAIADFRTPGGESFLDLQQRAWPAFEGLARRHQGSILIVTHAGVIRVLICRLLDIPLQHLFRIDQVYGGLTLVHGEPGGYRLQSLNLMSLAAI